jgi:hypothetical protein
VRNNPLKYVDPSGHDVVFIHGRDEASDDLNSTSISYWKDWISAYKGWGEDEWRRFISEYSDSSKRESLLKREGIRFYKYPNGSGKNSPVTDNEVNALAEQMIGMKDVTIVGHSKGANLVMNYIAAQWGGKVRNGPSVYKFVLDKAPSGLMSLLANARDPGKPFTTKTSCTTSCKTLTSIGNYASGKVVNVYSPFDPIGSMHELDGAINVIDNQSLLYYGIETNHGRGGIGTAQKVFDALDVEGDRNAYRP